MENVKSRWYKEAIVYQIYPFSFKDSNDDGMGDIKGIISKLDYVKDLGATAIWFSPLYDSPDHDYGYDIRDYYKIDPQFGTMDDFKLLLDECHKRGLRVIMDFVGNHTSNEHEWFKQAISSKDSPYRDYYIIRKGVMKNNTILPPNNWKATFTGSAWEKLPNSEDEYYLHLFSKEQPDLNWDNPKVREEVEKIFNFYFDLGVDGFRMDVFNVVSKVDGLPNDGPMVFLKGEKYYVDGPHIHEYMKELNENCFRKYDSYTVGESFSPSEENAFNYVKETNNELDSIFYFAHLQSDCTIANYLPKRFSLKQFKDGVTFPQKKYFNAAWNTLVLENHDQPRSVSRFDFNTNDYRYEIATMLPIMMFMQWGIPFIYEGEEIGMTNCYFYNIDECKDPVSHSVYNLMRKLGFSDSRAMKNMRHGARDNARCPMQWDDTDYAGFSSHEPWQRVNGNYKEINVKNDLSSDKSIYKFYQQVLKIKRENKTVIYGEFTELSHNDRSVYAYLRTLDNDKIFVVANFKDEEIEYKIPQELAGKELVSLISNYEDTEKKDSAILLAPYQATVYSVKE